MPKIKTHKAVAKRIRISGGKGKKRKFIQRSAGQDHFNARESGNTTKKKRRDRTVHKSNLHSVRKLLPYA